MSKLRLWIFLVLWGAARTAAAAVAYGADAQTWFDGGPGTGTVTHAFTPGAGSNRVLFVAVNYEANLGVAPAPTYGGTAMTLLRTQGTGSNYVWLYYLINPAAGPQNIVYSSSSGIWNPVAMTAYTYNGVHQTTPIGATAYTTGGPGGPTYSLSHSITPTNGGSTLMQLSPFGTGGCSTPTGFNTSAGTARHSAFSSSKLVMGLSDWSPGTFGTPVSYNHNYTGGGGCGSSAFNMLAVELMPAAPAGTSTNTPSITPTFTRTRTATPTYTQTPLPSATSTISPTPSMPLLKSSNVAQATIGETVTFCMNWTNDASGPRTIHYWDTISAYLTYVGCSAGCTRTASLVEWSTGAASYGSGQGCFWGTVNGYPP